MATNLGVKLKLYPNKKQIAYFEEGFNASRKVWNEVLGMQLKRYKNNKDLKFLGKYKTALLVTAMKKEPQYVWMNQIDCEVMSFSCAKLDQAWRDFFSHKQKDTGKPHFKSYKNAKQSFSGRGRHCKIVGKHYVKLPKIGCVKVSRTDFLSKDLKICTYTVTRSPEGKYWLSLNLEVPDKKKKPKTGTAVGIDVGLKDLAITSDGEKYPKFDGSVNEAKAKSWQSKFSRRYSKAKVLIAQDEHNKVLQPRSFDSFHGMNHAKHRKAHYQAKLAGERKSYMDYITTKLINMYDLIAIEDLKVSNMQKNHNLAHNIANQSWYQFRHMLEYKCDWYGKELVVVPPKDTSRICSKCGKKNDDFSKLSTNEWLKVREWDCPYCGAHHDRDVNAAKNILNKALKLKENKKSQANGSLALFELVKY